MHSDLRCVRTRVWFFVSQHAIPPPTGYGDDEDSLGSFYRLNPKAPKKDFNRLMERDGEVRCRWRACGCVVGGGWWRSWGGRLEI